MQDQDKGISGWWNSEPNASQTSLSLYPPPVGICAFCLQKKTHHLSLSLYPPLPPTHLGFKPRHLRVSHFWGWQTFLSHQGERSTTHQTRLHISAQDNYFSLFSFFSL
ncbi:hypothetical protein AMTRI_Chr12g270790 [Amborella trichopoda]